MQKSQLQAFARETSHLGLQERVRKQNTVLKLTDMFQHSEIPYEVTVKTEENFFF
jgi:hypothetical protein